MVYTSYMIILNKLEEKLLQCFSTIGMILVVASETLAVIKRLPNRVKYRK